MSGWFEFPTAKELLRSVRESFPATIARFTPRLYEETGRYHNPQRLIHGLVGSAAVMKFYGQFLDPLTTLIYAALARLLEHDVPTFFVSPELVQALYRTDLPVEEEWTNMLLPHEAACFVFPRNSVKHPGGYDIEGVVYARIKEGDIVRWPKSDGVDWPTLVEKTTRFITTTYLPDLGQAFVQNLTADEAPLIPQHPEQIGGVDLEGVSVMQLLGEDDTPLRLESGEKELMRGLTTLTFSIILYMLARPEEVAKGTLVKRVRPRRRKEHTREFWTPNIIGLRYRRQRLDATAEEQTDRSVRPHWRRGHFRLQPFGPKRNERKVIWIEPTFVRGGK